MATALLREQLPPGCQFAVTPDGRIFFIDDRQRTTSWLHPVTGLPVLTGLQLGQDLPQGWEQDITNDGRIYYIDHNRRATTFEHPLHGPPDLVNSAFLQRHIRLHSPETVQNKGNFNRGEPKQRSVKAPSAKRNPNSEVIKKGWLHRLESSGISKGWKRRWCVLADFALFFYKSDDELVTLDSILLPSYRVNPCTEADNVKRNFVFKVEHENTKTLLFATDDSPSCLSWMSVLRQATMMNGNVGFHREPNNNVRQHPMNKLPHESTHGPQPVRPGESRNISAGTPYETGGQPSNGSYKGYGDPAASPLATPTDHNFPASYGNPVYGSHSSVQQQRPNFSAQHGSHQNSFSNTSNRGSQIYPPASRDHSFNPNQSHTSTSFPGFQDSFTSQTRVQPNGHQHQPLLSNSARNSFSQPNPNRSGPQSYNPALTERQHLQQQLGNPPSGEQVLRDSYSDAGDGRVKQLSKWDQNFPSVEDEHLKHGSFDDLLDGRKSRHSGRNNTFNARSKSHENFSRLPGSQQYVNADGRFPDHTNRAGPSQHQNMGQHSPNVPQQQTLRDEQAYHGSKSNNQAPRPVGFPQGLPSQHIPSYQPQRESQRSLQHLSELREPHNSLRDSRDARIQQEQPQHQRVSNSSVGSSNSIRNPRNHSLPSSQHIPQQQQRMQPHGPPQQYDQRQQPTAHESLPRSQQAGHHTKPSLQLNLNNMNNIQESPSQNSPHIYVNLPGRVAQSHNESLNSSDPPARPPYPSTIRQQIVEEMAQDRTPSTQRDFLTSNQMNTQRMQQPAFFQYPSPRDQQKKQNSLDRSSNSLGRHSSHSLHNDSKSQLNPRLSAAGGPVSQEPHHEKDNSISLHDSFSRTNMMDPEARKLRFAYERVNSLRMSPDKAPARRPPVQIQTVKEDPNMSDRDILETNLQKLAKKNPLNGPRLRMSISAGDLIGKTHDELVLLLIQLRRNQSGLEKTRDIYRSQIDQRRPMELEYRRQIHQHGDVEDKRLLEFHHEYVEAKSQMEEIENKLEVYKPIINLLDNMVTMGSLYGGDNLMLATQYRKHLLRPDQYQPAKKMLEFSRKQQEEKLIQKTEEEIKQLSSDEVDLEEKIDRLNQLDQRLQEQSIRVSSFREDKELMEKALNGVLRQQDLTRNDPIQLRHLTQQQWALEKEISLVTQHLAEAFKELEETTAENSKLEYEVALLRNKVHGELTRSRSTPSLATESVRTKIKMEKELAKVEGIMQGLNKEGARLQQAMSTIRRSSSSSQLATALDGGDVKKSGTYIQTDLDTGEQIDLAKTRERNAQEGDNPQPVINHQRQNANASQDWDMENADDNTKRFFGLVPKEKPKGLTVRDVKRQAEQRKERDKSKKDGEESNTGEEIKLRVSNVDDETSSIIHAHIPLDISNQSTQGKWDPGHPLYENLRFSAPAAAETHSAPGSRRSSLILMTPKPFTRYQDKTARPFQSELELNSSWRPHLNSGLANGYNDKTPVTGVQGKQYHSADVLNFQPSNIDQTANNSSTFTNGSLHNTVDESNPYENDYPRNGHQSQILPDQLPTQSLPFHARSQSDVLGQPDLGDMKLSQAGSVYQQPTSENNSWQDQTGDPPASAFHITRPVNFVSFIPSRAYTARPWTKPNTGLSSDLFNVKKSPKGRYLTISSSQPLTMERNTLLSSTVHSSAGDLILGRPIDDVPDIIKSSQTKMDQIDEDTIEREILYIPEKVLIPERYDPDADAEQLTEEEKLRRREKAERIKRLLASQSVLSISQTDISQLDNNARSRIQQDQKERAHFLTLNQELARQVTLKSKKQAAERRKTWSGAQFEDIKRQYDEGIIMGYQSPR